MPEVREHCPDRPILLVGTQTDLREHGNRIASLKKKQQKPVRKREGEKLAKYIEAIRYMECSAMTQSGIIFIFQEAAKAVLEKGEQHVSITKRGLGLNRATPHKGGNTIAWIKMHCNRVWCGATSPRSVD